MTQQQPEASRIVEEAGIRILDELAVEGGRATRAHLFDKAQVKLWGHVVNVAARRAGYTGHNEIEVERHGKEQLFVEAVNLLLEREQIVVWDEEGKVIALHPTHRDDYVPGTTLWRGQRQTVLNELREQLMQFRAGKIIGDQPFDATLQKATALYAQQLRRGQLASDAREEAIAELLALADVLFDPARLASLFGVDESELRAAAARRLQPTPPATPSKRKQPKQSNVTENGVATTENGVATTENGVATADSRVATPPTKRYRKIRSNTFVTINTVAAYVQQRGAVTRGQLQSAVDLDAQNMQDLLNEFEQRYPGTVISKIGPNGRPQTTIHTPRSSA